MLDKTVKRIGTIFVLLWNLLVGLSSSCARRSKIYLCIHLKLSGSKSGTCTFGQECCLNFFFNAAHFGVLNTVSIRVITLRVLVDPTNNTSAKAPFRRDVLILWRLAVILWCTLISSPHSSQPGFEIHLKYKLIIFTKIIPKSVYSCRSVSFLRGIADLNNVCYSSQPMKYFPLLTFLLLFVF